MSGMLAALLALHLVSAIKPVQTSDPTSGHPDNPSLFSQQLNDKQILDRLLHDQRYDKRTKPALTPLQGRKLLSCSQSREFSQWAALPPDWWMTLFQPIRSRFSSLTLLLTWTKSQNFPTQGDFFTVPSESLRGVNSKGGIIPR